MAETPGAGGAAKKMLLGSYEVGSLLGRGPLGKVYRGKHTHTGELVVLRGFERPPNADEKHWRHAVHKFQEVLQAHHAVEKHHNIQSLIEWGEVRTMFYLVSEYFEGMNLRQILDHEGPRPVDWVVSFFQPVAAALDYAADRGVVHEDLTPYNVLLVADGSVRVINFGLGHVRRKEGSVYRAPEQVAGLRTDRRADVFALGVLMYETLVGRPPFAGETEEELVRSIRRDPMPRIEGPPVYVDDVIEKMLAKMPVMRYATCSEALDDLAGGRSPEPFDLGIQEPTPEVVRGAAPDLDEEGGAPMLGDAEDEPEAPRPRKAAAAAEAVDRYEPPDLAEEEFEPVPEGDDRPDFGGTGTGTEATAADELKALAEPSLKDYNLEDQDLIEIHRSHDE